ncbi:hypothetical protein [Ancylobacter sp.]|uniref:hypothetical protein n=1 Tax=Ancylobacter sp. TaxID=1872567 RepID=UPI003D142A51
MKRLSTYVFGRKRLAAAVLSAGAVLLAQPAGAANWENCVEAIAKTQHELKESSAKGPAQPKTQDQSVAAQDSHQPTPSSLAAAGLNEPQTGAAGALNEALNLQAAGNEAGCMKAVAKARSLAGLK